jgi:hypothetical protein
MNTTNQWLWLDEEAPPIEQSAPQSGAVMQFSLSSYDTPQAIRSYVSPEKPGCGIIQFRYVLNDEQKISRPINDCVEVEVGKNSGRVFRIKIDIARLRSKSQPAELHAELSQQLNAVVNRLFPSGKADRREEMRKDLTRKILNDNRSELLAAF